MGALDHVPFGQLMHTFDVEAPVDSEYLPGPHGVQVEDEFAPFLRE
jgi:hypothetical protein